MLNIKYYTKNVYGNELMYLADGYQASQWEKLTGKKTITKEDMLAFAELTLHVVEFERVFEPEPVK